jgi:hypothetical protein
MRSPRPVAVMRAAGAQELVSGRRVWRRRAQGAGVDPVDPYTMMGVTVAGILATAVIGPASVLLCSLTAALVGLPFTSGVVVLVAVAACCCSFVACWFAQPAVLRVGNRIPRSVSYAMTRHAQPCEPRRLRLSGSDRCT